jgi:uncharacterized membrane-anchored protein YitT (DUF2179 family)
MTNPQTHTLLEDAQGLLFGSAMAALGIAILTHLGLVTGQTAGLAILISYTTGVSFGLVFFVINLPFYWFGYRRFGGAFTLKTGLAVGLLSGFSLLAPDWLRFDHLDPVVGAVMFGLVSGSGLLALFRHGASLGGVGIMALWLQDRFGLRAGWMQLGFDAVLFALALWLLGDIWLIAVSALGALLVNLTIAINHRRDRYIAT